MDNLNQNIDNLEKKINDSLDLLRMSSEVFARQRYSAPDVSDEWSRFKNRKIISSRNKKGVYLWSFAGGAAVVAVVAVLLMNAGLFSAATSTGDANDGVVVFKAIDNLDGITLSSESGSVYNIGVGETDSLLAIDGVKVDEGSIDLRNTTSVEMQSLSIPRGKSFKVILSDDTEVWLNAESKLYYPSQFMESERVVYLEGEAYFKVKEDKNRPFVVNSAKMRTKVLGTEFNVRSYTNITEHVTLVEGSVWVDNVSTNKGVTLSAGQDVSINSEGDFVLKEVDPYGITLWRDGYFYFNNVSINDIVKDIGRWYNVDITFVNPSISDFHLHFTANRNAGLEHVLDKLNTLQKVNASFIDGEIIIE